MADKRKAIDDMLDSDEVRVEAIAQFRHDGAYVKPGARLVMSARDAEDLLALRFVRTYGRRDMRSTGGR